MVHSVKVNNMSAFLVSHNQSEWEDHIKGTDVFRKACRYFIFTPVKKIRLEVAIPHFVATSNK
jgi:phosphoribosyl 1,2-cyclic phosphodiesterase